MSTRALQWPWKLCKIAETMWIWGRLLEVQKYFRQSCRWNIPFPNPCHCIVLKQHAILFCVYILMFTITTRYARQVGGGGRPWLPSIQEEYIYLYISLERRYCYFACIIILGKEDHTPPSPTHLKVYPPPSPSPTHLKVSCTSLLTLDTFQGNFFKVLLLSYTVGVLINLLYSGFQEWEVKICILSCRT